MHEFERPSFVPYANEIDPQDDPPGVAELVNEQRRQRALAGEPTHYGTRSNRRRHVQTPLTPEQKAEIRRAADWQ